MRNSGLCKMCQQMKDILIHIAGSGMEITYICKQCIEERRISILQEYIEKYDVRTEAL